jgi:hypothetical protein
MATAELETTNDELMAAQQLPTDLALIKMENEQIFSVARAAPRDPMKIVRDLKQLIEAYPAAADEAIYSKPVGTVTRINCGDCKISYEVNKVDKDTACPACDGKNKQNAHPVKKYAEGLSIRAAESIRSIYGYTRLATTSEMQPDGTCKISGVLVDYAACNITSDERIVTPWYKSQSGQMTKTPEDRFLNVVVKAEKAKLRRDVILDSVPNIVKAAFKDLCETKLEELITPEVVEQKIIPAFAEYGITEEHLCKIVGRSKSLGWREQDRLQLKKLLTALRNEETTVREILSELNGGPKQNGTTTAASGAASAGDLMNPKRSQPSSQPASASQPNTLNAADMKEYLAQVAIADSVKSAQACYDKWFGPTSKIQWTDDEHAAGAKAKDDIQRHLLAKRGSHNGQLFSDAETVSNA